MSDIGKAVLCPVCGRKLDDHAYLPEMGGTYRDDNYYECLVHGPIDKEFVDAVIKRIAELEAENAELNAGIKELREMLEDEGVEL